MFFLQMSGFPGSGKSTLAKEIGKYTNAIIVDHDIVKSALVEELPDDVDPKRAGGIAYHIEWALVDYHLSQRHSVILDSPCLYDPLVEKGIALAAKHRAKYKYVECILNDIHTLNERLRARERMITQIGPVDIPEDQWQAVINRAKKPSGLPCMQVDTSLPLGEYIYDVLSYIHQ
ncbi:ATP-binding protein [Paenibacillus lycopersici]|uniref:ATP-binding protein n=1 Tax=Paenibacillus lycopersici TaxID=2704462 RepID=A0A6C0FUH3_9BACL|nr:ATP-binding protein [Paenibacillus lycopersici]QHT58974.1 ATP-binding protein [Paenibacillus lycopersici]